MSVRKTIPYQEGIYSITITCNHWHRLFEITNGYDVVYSWFDVLKGNRHFILGYVIMPNHLHAVIGFRNMKGRTINSVIGNGKRFMLYEIVKRLIAQNEMELLSKLAATVNKTDRKKGKLHEVFEPSFDWKECWGSNFIEQKLDYIHGNPCRGSWNLVNDWREYVHSSAKYYVTGEQGVYEVISYTELEDIDLTE